MIFDVEYESMPRETLEAIQVRRLQTTVERAYANVPFYRENFKKCGVSPADIRTRDTTSLNPEPCICGRTHLRMNRITGRSDDMLIICGVNVFPSQIEGVLMEMDNFPDGHQTNTVNNRVRSTAGRTPRATTQVRPSLHRRRPLTEFMEERTW